MPAMSTKLSLSLGIVLVVLRQIAENSPCGLFFFQPTPHSDIT